MKILAGIFLVTVLGTVHAVTSGNTYQYEAASGYPQSPSHKLYVKNFYQPGTVHDVTSGNTHQYEAASGYLQSPSHKLYVKDIYQPNYGYENYDSYGYGYGGYGLGGYRPSAYRNYRPYYAATYRPNFWQGSGYLYDPYFHGSYDRGIIPVTVAGYDNDDWKRQ